MDVVITRLTPDTHRLRVERDDGTVDQITLSSRSFLQHDLAHLAVESELGIQRGFWGSVAAGASLSGTGPSGSDIALAESLAGPVQTLMRTEADTEAYRTMLEHVAPSLAHDRPDLAIGLANEVVPADRLHERIRRLRGHLAATPFGREMRIAVSFDAPTP